MKRVRNTVKSLSKRNTANDFVRGALASGVAVAATRHGRPRLDRSVVRTALQGGAALAAATVAADEAQRGRWLRATLAAALAVAGVYALQRLLPDAAPNHES